MDHKHHSKEHISHHQMMVKEFKNKFIFCLILTVPILILSPLIQEFFGFEFKFKGDEYLIFILSGIVFFYGGLPFFKGMIRESKNKRPGMMTLVALAITISFFYSMAGLFGFIEGKLFFWEMVTLIDIMLLGHWIEMRSVLGASKSLESLAKLIPSEAHLIGDGEKIEDVSVAEIKVNDIVLVKPGEKIPADGVIIEGETNINESLLTGESKPKKKGRDDKVIAGSINIQGAVKVRVEKTGKDSYVSQIISLVKKAQETKSKSQDLANRASFWLTIISISFGIITLLIWLNLGESFSFALERMVAVMVITCPHALGLAVPLVVAFSTSIAVRNGFLIKNRAVFEKARNIKTVIFDKTGTLTRGDFGVTDVVARLGHEKKELIFYAASVESNSEHQIAKGILKKAREEQIEIAKVDEFISFPGKGVQGLVNGQKVQVVGQSYLKEKEAEVESSEVDKLLKQGKTIVYVLLEDKLLGAIALADSIREESRGAVEKLKSMRIKCLMLTGDIESVAKWVKEELNLDGFFAGILPHEKSEIIKKVQSDNINVAMVGDGVNDAPALAQADVGIAIGAGTDVAIESADIILVRNNPADVVALINLARATYSKMKQNLFWATFYNIFALPLAAGVLYNYGILLSPALGALFMSLSTVVVAINARFFSIKK
jgi:Cu2+-exporting ATPase